ncbi:pilus assembly protein [soil metagenome]
MMRRRFLFAVLRPRRERDGSSAIEFAMVAFPFIFMMFAIIEIGMVFITDSVLENATIETGRLIRTGQVAGSQTTAAQFKTQFCSRMSIFSSQCSSRATIDVRVITQFRNQNPPDPMANGTTFDTSKLVYQPGSPGSLMLVRVFYTQPLFTPFLAQGLSRLGDGNTTLTATTTFRNEPYDQ